MSTADKLNKLIQTKADIKQALIDKGVEATDVFSTYADAITNLKGSSGGVFDFASIGYTGDEEPIKSDLAYAKEILESWDNSITTMKEKFKDDTKLAYFPLVDTSNVTNLFYAFYGCSELKVIPQIDTINVTSMLYTFGCCRLLTNVPLFDYSNVTEISSLFELCTKLKYVGYIDCSQCNNIYKTIHQTLIDYNPYINTENLKSTANGFSSSNIVEPDLTNFNTSNVETMANMFEGCRKIKKLDLSSFDTSKTTNMSYMFLYVGYNTDDVPVLILPENFGSACKNMIQMFASCKFTYISSIDSAVCTAMDSIFYNSSLVKAESISLKSMSSVLKYTLFGYSSNSTMRYIICKDVGYSSTIYDFTYMSNWGVEDETIELSIGARQSLIDSLITYSFDRANAGYSTCTITLSTNTKALLTEDEIAQITAKGFTIA